MSEKLDLIRQKCIEAGAAIEIQGCSEHWGQPPSGDCKSCRHNFYRPIRLADVLLAIDEGSSSVRRFFIGPSLREGFGCWYKLDNNDDLISCAETNSWNLREDDLTKQSTETIDFLYDLLS